MSVPRFAYVHHRMYVSYACMYVCMYVCMYLYEMFCDYLEMKTELRQLGCFCAGISGDNIQNVLYRLDTLQLLSVMPDNLQAVVLLIGTNNVERYTAEAVCGGIIAIVESIRRARPTLGACVFGLLPRGPWPGSPVTEDVLTRRILSSNAQVEAAVKALGCIYHDAWEVFAPERVRVARFFRNDTLHLSNSGYHVLQVQLRKALKALGLQA